MRFKYTDLNNLQKERERHKIYCRHFNRYHCVTIQIKKKKGILCRNTFTFTDPIRIKMILLWDHVLILHTIF